MKLHILTIGEPKLPYAKSGWAEYTLRLKHHHTVRFTHLPDKWAYDSQQILKAVGASYKVALEITGKQLTSPALAEFLEKHSLNGREVCFIIGGPNGLPTEVIAQADFKWSLSSLTLPHDLAMVVLAEALYRASTINAGLPYHK